MAEYIERSMVVKELKQFLIGLIEKDKDAVEVTEFNVEMQKIIKHIPAADVVEAPKWIPAKEPPKESNEFIVMIHKAANPTSLLYDADLKSWFEVVIEDGEEVYTYYPVDYWMPLPDPPQGE